MLKIIFLICYVILSAVHLKDSWADDAKKRARTKPFLLIFLALFYVFAAEQMLWVLLLALLTSWLGDVLLIPKGNLWFTLGGVSFLLSHLLFIAVYLTNINFSGMKWYIVIPAAVIYYGIAFAVIRAVAPTTPKQMVVPMYLYLLANSTMNVFALMQLLANRNAGAAVAYVGAVLFFASDSTLFLVRYHKNPDIVFKRHFTVMLTYLAGEFLITLGILMLQG